MTLTAYTLSYDECGPDLTPALSTSKCVVGETVAVSPDLSSWLGKFVYIEGFGVRYVNYLTADRFSNRVDILVASKKEAFDIGCKKGIFVCPFDM
jgi:3D (Asp-Asp-Asp) domain-containing protein